MIVRQLEYGSNKLTRELGYVLATTRQMASKGVGMNQGNTSDESSDSPERKGAVLAVRRVGPEDEDLVRSALSLFDNRIAAEPAEFVSDSKTLAFIAEKGGEIAGWLYGYELLRPDGHREALIYSVDVAEDYRGRGYGRALIAAFLAEARQKSYTEVWTLTDDDNTVAQSLYTNTGGGTGQGQVMYTWEDK